MTLPFRRSLIAGLLSLLAATALPASAHEAHAHAGPPAGSSKLVQTQAALRDLWLGHAFWVRAVTAETLGGNEPAAAVAEERAVANAGQLAAAVEPFYGSAGKDEVFKLLGGHYAAVKRYVLATRGRDAAKQEAARQAMLDNAQQIAVFLSGANPHLPIDALRGMLLAHGGHHLQQIHQLADKDYAGEARTWEDMKTHMYAVADALAVAIARQFPARFE